MKQEYNLSGSFIECCDCYTICPCWINEKPDEDQCSGLYVWTFDPGSKVAGYDVGGKSIAAATYHSKRTKGQAALFVDHTLASTASQAILRAFAGDAGGSLRDLSKLLGQIITRESAKITTNFANDDWHVSIEVAGQRVAQAKGEGKVVDTPRPAMSMLNTALSKELGIQGAVIVQAIDTLDVAVTSLPNGVYQLQGRSGMRGKFHYK